MVEYRDCLEVIDWMENLKSYAKSICGADIVDWYSFDFEDYADAYDFGYSPKEAWHEEMGNWDAE